MYIFDILCMKYYINLQLQKKKKKFFRVIALHKYLKLFIIIFIIIFVTIFTPFSLIYKVDHFNQYTRISQKHCIKSKNVSDISCMA